MCRVSASSPVVQPGRRAMVCRTAARVRHRRADSGVVAPSVVGWGVRRGVVAGAEGEGGRGGGAGAAGGGGEGCGCGGGGGGGGGEGGGCRVVVGRAGEDGLGFGVRVDQRCVGGEHGGRQQQAPALQVGV